MRKNKRGGTTIFVALILSALIFVEGIYLALIIDVNRRMLIDRALKLQVEQILASYNEELFLEYGIYGFIEDDINHDVYVNTLEASGYSYGEDIFIEGYRTINTVQLEKAISTYYSYRIARILFKDLSELMDYIKQQLDEYEFVDKLKKFKSSGGKKVLKYLDIASSTIEEIIDSDEIKELFEISDSEGNFLSDFIVDYLFVNDSELRFDKDFDPEEFLAFDFFDDVTNLSDIVSNTIQEDFYALSLAHYAVNNFESVVKEYEEDGEMVPSHNLRGTSFRDLNPEEVNDMEFVVTGLRGAPGIYIIGHVISGFIVLAEVVNLILNDKFMTVCKKISEVLSKVYEILLDGFTIPPVVFEIVILIFVSLALMIKDMVKIYNGETVNVLKISKAPEPYCNGFPMNYKDFVFYFALCYRRKMLPNMIEVLEEKYGKIYTKIEIGTIYNDTGYYADEGYGLYGF